MERLIKYTFALSAIAVWAAAMIDWIWVKKIQPDPAMWGVPGGLILLLFPQRREGTPEDK